MAAQQRYQTTLIVHVPGHAPHTLVCHKRLQKRVSLTACDAPDWYVVKVVQSHIPTTKREKDREVVVEPQQGEDHSRNNTQLCAKRDDRPERIGKLQGAGKYQGLGQGEMVAGTKRQERDLCQINLQDAATDPSPYSRLCSQAQAVS